jgi:hypothetical protein
VLFTNEPVPAYPHTQRERDEKPTLHMPHWVCRGTAHCALGCRNAAPLTAEGQRACCSRMNQCPPSILIKK